jgi:hypothetical protein
VGRARPGHAPELGVRAEVVIEEAARGRVRGVACGHANEGGVVRPAPAVAAFEDELAVEGQAGGVEADRARAGRATTHRLTDGDLARTEQVVQRRVSLRMRSSEQASHTEHDRHDRAHAASVGSVCSRAQETRCACHFDSIARGSRSG